MSKRRVVITGLGAVTPVGLTMPETWQAIQAGVCGVAPITRYDTAGRKVTLAAEVKGFDAEAHFGKLEARHMDRFCQFALVAAREALADAHFDVQAADSDRCGVAVSSGIGGFETTEEAKEHGLAKGYDRVSPFMIPGIIGNMAAGRVAIDAGF